MNEVWAEEIEREAEMSGVSVEALGRLVGSGRETPREAPPLDEAEMMRRLGRLLVSAAEELESIGADAAHVGSARGGLLGLTAVAAVLEVPKLAEWTARLAVSEELAALSSDAARMLRGEAFEMVWTQSLLELRACDWRWPERREAKEPSAPTARVSEPEPVAALATEAEPEPLPEPEPVPEPMPAPVEVAPSEPPSRRAVTRALVADPSGIAASFLARILVSRGVEVTLADSAGGVSAQVAHGGFDLVFVAAEWPLTGPTGATAMIVRLIAEGASHSTRPGERTLVKPPAEEEVDGILEAWAGRHRAS